MRSCIPQPTRIESAARIATAYLPAEEPGRWPWSLASPVIAALSLGLWIIIAAVLGWL